MVKNLPASAGDESSIPGLGRSISFPNTTHSSILAWRIPWTEEPGGLQSIGSQREDMTEHPHTHTHTQLISGIEKRRTPELRLI